MRKRLLNSELQTPKYREITDRLTQEISAGKYRSSQKLPSESELVKRFGASRITVGRALRELTQAGLIRRVAGSGSFVREPQPAASAENPSLVFGLLIPNLGQAEIFDPICRGMADAPDAETAGLLWGHTDPSRTKEEQALELCRQFLERKVSGVFFAPLEGTLDKDRVNREVMHQLEAAKIPTVLLDRDIAPFPERTAHDLVGIDNRRVAYLATKHLLACGARRVVFLDMRGAAATSGARQAGYREALPDGYEPLVRQLESFSSESVQEFLQQTENPDGFLCINDRTAGLFMQSVLRLGLRVPQDLQIMGIDDVEYARLLPVPLTTVRQPCREIGAAAMSTMRERLARPQRVAREVLLACELVERQSTKPR